LITWCSSFWLILCTHKHHWTDSFGVYSFSRRGTEIGVAPSDFWVAWQCNSKALDMYCVRRDSDCQQNAEKA